MLPPRFAQETVEGYMETTVRLTARQAAAQMGITSRSLRQRIESGTLKAEMENGRWMIDARDLAKARRAATPQGGVSQREEEQPSGVDAQPTGRDEPSSAAALAQIRDEWLS